MSSLNSAKIVAFIVFLLISVSLRSEITEAGQYWSNRQTTHNQIFYADVWQDDSVRLYVFDYGLGRLEIFNFQLSNQTGTTISNKGRGATFTLGKSPNLSANVTIAGESFLMLNRSPTIFGIQTTYTGTIILEPSRASLISRITHTSDSSFIMLWAFDDGNISGGIGTIQNGQATVETVGGGTLSFPFLPQDNILYGSANWSHSGGTPAFDFITVEAVHPSMVNISTRGWIGGGQSMTSGTVITGGAKKLLIRAVGPTLAGFGVGSPHPDPRIKLFQGQTELDANDDWSTVEFMKNRISGAAAYVGAFGLVDGSKDACLLVSVTEGAYTIIVEGDGDPGEVIVEVYEVR